MAKIVKPDLTYQWASAAGGGSVAPNSTKIQTGHIVEKPNYEYMNWLQNRQDTSIAYTFQMGVPEWDSLVALVFDGTNVRLYVNGTFENPAISSGPHNSWPVGDRFLNVGYDVEGAIDGYINDLRISDYAVYTSDFTPPTSPF